MGSRIQARVRASDENRIALRLTAAYLAVFVLVVVALSAVAYAFVAGSYRDALEPALGTPEGRLGLARALHAAAASILLVDLALVVIVGSASYGLARAAVAPLSAARKREERFAADAAHELRTPLTAIAALAYAARDRTRSPDGSASEIADSLDTIAARALEAGDLVGDMLTLARRDDAAALICEPVDLAGIVSVAVARAQSQARSRGVALDFVGQSVVVDGDERRLSQLAANLLENAVRYARSRVEVRVQRTAREARLSVHDDGAGVPPQLRSRLFERFVKSSDSNGSGLGLAICRWITRAHGGEITLAGGSQFLVCLPLKRYAGNSDESN